MLSLLRKTNELFGSTCFVAEIVRLLGGERYLKPLADEKTAVLFLKMVNFSPSQNGRIELVFYFARMGTK